MSKAQSVVIQFLLFFLIGFSIFISIGSFFRYQSDLFRQSIASSGLNLTGSYISSAIVAIADSCKECDFVNLSLSMYNTSAGYTIGITAENSRLKIYTIAGSIGLSAHNLLNYTIKAFGYSSPSKPIILTFNKTNNNLEVS
jgi:hypothetical protein